LDLLDRVGCQLEPEFSWKNAPSHAYILGLKELPKNDFPLTHTHIYFGHCYKGQLNSMELLRRFVKGNGLLLDLEFLVNDTGRRVAAFGYHAGFAGAAVGLMIWAKKELNQSQGLISPYSNESLLLNDIDALLKRVGKP
jgi:saccharopine dehydrogenase (NAD+, L-lysine-forming)